MYYPNANSTMRTTYGTVGDYVLSPDAVHYDYVTTLDGVIEKYVPGDHEFDLPTEAVLIFMMPKITDNMPTKMEILSH